MFLEYCAKSQLLHIVFSFQLHPLSSRCIYILYNMHCMYISNIVLHSCILLGKSSLKKTVYGEYYDPRYKPTLGIDADPSITRITFKQYKEWILQNASKADARRLNLEYIDIIIDYVLSALQQPRVSDDSFDVGKLHIEEKDRPLKVDFNPSDVVIPEQFDEDSCTISEDGEMEEPRAEVDGGTNTSVESHRINYMGVATQEEENDTLPVNTTTPTDVSEVSSNILRPSSTSVQQETASKEISTYRRHSAPTQYTSFPKLSPQISGRTCESTTPVPNSSKLHSRVSIGEERVLQRDYKSDTEPLFQARGELSRLLLENVPREILKRMVIRWPVGDEPVVVSRAELNKQRLMITVWDVSGDPLQHNFTPFFFSHRCLFISLYNLTRALNDASESYASRNLRDVDGKIPTNAEALENWLGYVNAFSTRMPMIPFRCSNKTPVIPPVIVACSFADMEEVKEHPITFHDFFRRPSFSSYRKHLVDGNEPSALVISSKFENEGEEAYAGHNLLRREIDHLARQMPFCTDNVPIQWVKFEQLIYGLQEQKKIILLYNDLTRYVSEHCKVSGTLQMLPILSHFHDVGVISHFYRHPLLSNIIITRPQWLADALGSVIVSSPSRFVTTEVQVAFTKLAQEGIVSKDMLLLAYRCGKMHQRYWNETLFILNCMDLVCCHPSCHPSESLYIPCLVSQLAPPLEPLADSCSDDSSSTVLHFSSGSAAFPIAVYNQFIVRSIRSCGYSPKLFYGAAHLQLTPSYHLLVLKHHTSISIQIQCNHSQCCQPCLESDTTHHPPSTVCSHIQHILGEELEYSPTDNIGTLIDISTKLTPTDDPFLPSSPDDSASLALLCPQVLSFAKHHLNFLTGCWFPGLRLDLLAHIDNSPVVLDQYWQHNVLRTGKSPPSLRVWFD